MSFDPRDRELCPDGSCIGVIGPDGRCKECGKLSPLVSRDPRNVGLAEPPEPPEPPIPAAAEPDLLADEDERELCPDGSCVGLIGPDGRCSECGKPREWQPD